ncbi:hypothetical protein ACFYZ9_17675 [Streptomyces sp. NPDC001691]|uniref:hypothetical protein n=1 Tax=Streptomyces sp. NPDC001691 TaxID=3364600 RepID=UPI0036C74B30
MTEEKFTVRHTHSVRRPTGQPIAAIVRPRTQLTADQERPMNASTPTAVSPRRIPAQAQPDAPHTSPPSPEVPGSRLRRQGSSPRTVWNATWPALAIYGASAVLHLVLLAVMSPADGPGVHAKLLSWDGSLYRDIAQDGYPDSFAHTPSGELTGNNLAFFPAYPALIRIVHTLTGLGYDTAAIVAAHLSMIAALVAVHHLLCRTHDRRTATVAAVLLACAQPMALAFFMAYSESLFLALAAATLLAAHREAWLTAGFLALLAGLTRPAAAAVALALGVAVLLHLVRERRLLWRPITAVALACAGTPAYLAWVGQRLHQPNAWFAIQQAGWDTRWDNGRAFWDFLGDTFTDADGWVPVSTAVLLLALIVATALAWRRGTWPPLLVYGTGILVLTLAQSNYYHCKLRLVVPALVFLIPLARALGRTHARTAAIVLSAASLFGCWYGAYMLTTWHYAI